MNTPLDTRLHDIPRRDPATVMRLARMGAAHQGRLSFMRILLRRMKAENWQFIAHMARSAVIPLCCSPMICRPKNGLTG